VRCGHLIILLIDANARVGSVLCEAVGAIDANIENNNGSRLRQSLSSSSLFAVNTFHSAGHTWTSSFGTKHRIDYVCLPSSMAHSITQCKVSDEIDLSTSEKEDHGCLAVSFSLYADSSPHELVNSFLSKQRKASYNTFNLKVPHLRDMFEQRMWYFKPSEGACIDQHLDELNKYILQSAILVFGCPVTTPLKPWISQRTWQYVRPIALMRRTMHQCSQQAQRHSLYVFFLGWASSVSTDSALGRRNIIYLDTRWLRFLKRAWPTGVFGCSLCA